MTAIQLASLGEPNWGERLYLARRRSHVGLETVAELITRVAMPVSHASLTRLEQLTGPPTDNRRRAIAFCALLVYGFNPEDFGLSKDDLPNVVDLQRLRDLLKRQNSCFPRLAA